jgi:4-amino-4-deoxy-L-arabinose transferase-like glycosyltransferase
MAAILVAMADTPMTTDTTTVSRPQPEPSRLVVWLLFAAIFAAVQFGSLFSPPLLDDVDAAQAQCAQTILDGHGWVTTYIDGIRYIEKPPMPYWLVAISFKVFGQNAFATHLPNALAMLGLAWLSWLWASRAWNPRVGFYAGLGVLTSVGAFLFTRFIIPESIMSFFLLAALYGLLTCLEDNRPNRAYIFWIFAGLATMMKGLIAPVFFFGAAIPYLALTGQWRRWRELRPFTGILAYLAVAAPWHILCGLQNPDQGLAIGNHPTIGNVHGFFYFYFVNEHFLRFFSMRYPHDYNKLPHIAYWLLHFVWIFPWSLFLPAALVVAWKTRRRWMQHLHREAGMTVDFYLDNALRQDPATSVARQKFRVRSTWLLGLFAAWVLIFFAISSNQEYYTFMAWPPIIMLISAVIVTIETGKTPDGGKASLSTAWLTGAQAVFAVIGVLSAIALGWGLWTSRNLPFVPDIGTLLAHRAVAGYTLAMSHLFDLTGPAFAALRLPAALAAVTLLIGPAVGWWLRLKGRHVAATVSVAITMAVFLVAAHIAFARFAPMLSSKQLADTIVAKGSPSDQFIIYGEESDASSVIFYTHKFFGGKPADLVVPRCGQHGEGTVVLWGSCYPDAPNIFLSDDTLSKAWGTGERKWIFAQDANQTKVEQLLAGRLYPVDSVADKALWTDRPLN